MPYPTFIVIGAMKSGTTSLFRYLATHPETSVSSVKETNYFLGRHEYDRGMDWYLSLFGDANTKAVGEASPNYTKRHLWPKTAELMAQTLPDIKLIYAVRDPISRIVSHYVHNYAFGQENGLFSKVIRSRRGYVRTSMYAYQIEPFLDYYAKDNVLVVDSSRLSNHTGETLPEIFRFIGVDPDYEVPNTEAAFHMSADKRRHSFLERHVKNPHHQRALRPFLPSRLKYRQKIVRPALSADDLNRLTDWLHPDIERFRALTGKRFSDWQV